MKIVVFDLDGTLTRTCRVDGECYAQSAEFKIRQAGLPLANVPSAFAEDGPSREAIVQAAIERACEAHCQGSFSRIVAVGDSPWDVRTARRLELPFLGIAEEPTASLLRANGASHVVENYLDPEGCLRLLEEVRAP